MGGLMNKKDFEGDESREDLNISKLDNRQESIGSKNE
jgi:hypothetical protein